MSHIRRISVPLDDREEAYLTTEAGRCEVTRGHILRWGLRYYQLHQEFPELGGELVRLMQERFGDSPGCMGDE